MRLGKPLAVLLGAAAPVASTTQTGATACDFGAPGFDTGWGHGEIGAFAAVSAAAAQSVAALTSPDPDRLPRRSSGA